MTAYSRLTWPRLLPTCPRRAPESVAQQTFDAVEAGQVEVLADERTRTVNLDDCETALVDGDPTANGSTTTKNASV
jgi:hypothetical protein